jgi:pyridoxine 4-dehydrogenase
MEVSVLGLGTSRLASLGTRHSRRDVARLLDTASEQGVNFIDTADTYGSGACERLLGVLLRGQPERFTIATKGGLGVVDLPVPLRPLNQLLKAGLRRTGRAMAFDPIVIARRIDGSLRRLRRDAIDLYFLHDPPLPALTDDLVQVMLNAIAAGKIVRFGVSSHSDAVLEAAARIPDCRILQTRVGAADPEGSPLSAGLEREDVEVVAHQVLTGPFDSATEEVIERKARASGLGRPGVLIRHAASLPKVRVVLVGTGNRHHLEHAARALSAPISVSDRLPPIPRTGAATVN